AERPLLLLQGRPRHRGAAAGRRARDTGSWLRREGGKLREGAGMQSNGCASVRKCLLTGSSCLTRGDDVSPAESPGYSFGDAMLVLLLASSSSSARSRVAGCAVVSASAVRSGPSRAWASESQGSSRSKSVGTSTIPASAITVRLIALSFTASSS